MPLQPNQAQGPPQVRRVPPPQQSAIFTKRNLYLFNRSTSIGVSLLLATGGILLSLFSVWQAVETFVGVSIENGTTGKVALSFKGLFHVFGMLVGIHFIINAALHAIYRPARKWLIIRRVSIATNMISFAVFVFLLLVVSIAIQHYIILLTIFCYGCCFVFLFCAVLDEIVQKAAEKSVQNASGAEGDAFQHTGVQNYTVSSTQNVPPPPPGDDLDRLPPLWEKKFDHATNRFFYIDHSTRRTTWIHPSLEQGNQNAFGEDTLNTPQQYRQQHQDNSKNGGTHTAFASNRVEYPPFGDNEPPSH